MHVTLKLFFKTDRVATCTHTREGCRMQNDSYDHSTYTQELINLNENDLVEGAEGGI